MSLPNFFFVLLVSVSFSMCGNKTIAPPAGNGGDTSAAPNSITESVKPLAITDLKEGPNLVRYANGVKQYEGTVKDGKREGKWAYWYDNGTPWSECEYKEGKKDGRTTVWYENGNKRYEGFYGNDKRSGKWTYWDEKGSVVEELTY